MQQRVRIRDIAEELGLSTASVSNVIHGKTDKVSDETLRRVQALLEERQYIPSMAGILLAQNASKIIGVFIHDHEKYEGRTLEDVFIASALNDLSVQIEAHGQFMMVKQARHAEDVLKFASMWNMDGVVMLGFCQQDYVYLRSHMRIPFVVYDGLCDKAERFVNIAIDDFDGGRQVGAMLRQSGHRRALCIADNHVGIDQARIDGFRAGFGAGETAFLEIPMHRDERLRLYRQALSRFHQVTAVFAVSDYYAIELMHALQENGFQIPRELSIVGFDDIPMCQLVHPTLTTVRQDGALRAKLALERLWALKAGEAADGVITLPVTLVQRGSTAVV